MSKWKKIYQKVDGACIAHRKFEIARKEFDSALGFSSGGSIVELTGLSGSGKSRMTELAYQTARDHDVPAAMCMASNTGYQGQFDGKGMVLLILDSLGYPGLSPDSSPEYRDKATRRLSRQTNSELNRLLMDYVKNLGVRYLFIDEAQHMQYMGRNHLSIDPYLNYWKAFAEKTGLVLVLVGSYRLHELLSGSDHLVRRTKVIHLARYEADREEDMVEFYRVLQTLSEWIPVKNRTGKLTEWGEDLYYGSFGCVGQLICWLLRAISLTNAWGRRKLDIEAVSKAMMSPQQAKSVAEEIEIGRRFLPSSRRPSFKGWPDACGKPERKRAPRGQVRPFEQKPRRYERGNRSKPATS